MIANYLLNFLLQGLPPLLITYILLSKVQFVSIVSDKISYYYSVTFTGLYNNITMYYNPARKRFEVCQTKGITNTWLGSTNLPTDLASGNNYLAIVKHNCDMLYFKFPELLYKATWPACGCYDTPSLLIDQSWLKNPYNRGAQ